MKTDRKEIIASIINHGEVKTQEELVAALRSKGIYVTQATLSRDMKELGAIKVPMDGDLVYRIPASYGVSGHSFEIGSIEVSGQICVILCRPGFASAVASVVDRASINGVMGTVAGDDTVLVLLREDAEQNFVKETIRKLF